MRYFIQFGLSVIIICSIGYAENLKECESEEDKIQGCVAKLEVLGFPVVETPYKNGKEDGIQKWYYHNGKLWRETPYKNGKEDGIAKYYSENGKLMQETSYKNGKRDGIAKYYSENGKLRSETPYKDGKLDGIEKYYSENGNLIATMTYQKGKAISAKCANGRVLSGEYPFSLDEINMHKTCG